MLKQNLTTLLNPAPINRPILAMFTNKQDAIAVPCKISSKQKILKHNFHLIINNVIIPLSTYGL